MTMRKSTLWTLVTALLAVLVLVGAWFLVLAPQRAQAADLATQRNFVAAQNDQLVLKQAQLQSEFEQLPGAKSELAGILATLPDDTELPQLLRQLESSAANTRVTLSSVVPGTPVAYDATAAPGVVSLPVVVTVAGSFTEVELYLEQLQAASARFFLIDSVVLNAGTDAVSASSRNVSATVSGKVFALTTAAATTATETPGTVAAPTTVAPAAASPTTAATGGSSTPAGSTTLS